MSKRSLNNNSVAHSSILPFPPNFQQSGAAELTVTIVACGPCPYAGGGLIYAVTVNQPVQSWTVVRSHDDFRDLGEALLPYTLPSFPVLLGSDDTFDVVTVVKARNELQGWLSALLMHPNAHAVPAVSNFLTLGANTIPPQYEGVAWTQFVQPAAQSPINATIYSPQQQQPQHQQQNRTNVNVDDMEMDEMFKLDEDENVPAPQEDQEFEEDFIPAAAVRYKPTDEAATYEDEMDVLQLSDPGEVELVEDLGSLAQSMGASHLGRSLQLQADKRHSDNKNPNSNQNNRLPQQSGPPKVQQGLNIGGSSTQLSPAVGGIGSAMERAANNAHFNHKPPVSAPRLDSFKIIKVIGKGSFGKHLRKWMESLELLFRSPLNVLLVYYVYRQSFSCKRDNDVRDLRSQGSSKGQHHQAQSSRTYEHGA